MWHRETLARSDIGLRSGACRQRYGMMQGLAHGCDFRLLFQQNQHCTAGESPRTVTNYWGQHGYQVWANTRRKRRFNTLSTDRALESVFVRGDRVVCLVWDGGNGLPTFVFRI